METITEMDLARLVFGADEMKCEVNHLVRPCTEEVTHQNISRHRVRNLCQNATLTQREWIEQGALCADCNLECQDCWTIRPI